MAKLQDGLYRLLRWSERYTKTDMVYLARGGFWSIVGQLVSALTVFALAIVVGRYLPKGVYGQYKYILATVALLSTLSLNGLGTAVFQSVARGFDGALQEGFWANIRWSAAVFIGAFALAGYYFLLHNSTLAFGILLGGCLSPFLASANLASAFLTAKKDFARVALYYGVIETLLSTGILIFAVLITKNPLILAAIYFFSNTFATLWLYFRVTHVYKPDAEKRDSETISYGKHLSAMGILNGIAGNIDQVILFHFVGPIQLAVYNFAIAIPDQAKGPLKVFDSMVQAQFAHRSDREIRQGMLNKTIWLFIISAIAVLFYYLLAPLIFRIFFPSYADAVFFTRIYAMAYLADSFNPAISYLIIKRKIREQYISNISLSIFRIVALLIGTLYWGLLGIITARIIVRFAGTILNYILFIFSSQPSDGNNKLLSS